jgi:CDP-glycerol glycerophosphotransferase
MTGPQTSVRPVIDEYGWSGQGRLTLRGSYPAGPGQAAAPGQAEAGPGQAEAAPVPLEVVLARQDSADQHVLACARDGDRFRAGIDVTALPSFGQLLPLRDGIWDIYLRQAGTAGAELIAPRCDGAALAGRNDARLSFGRKIYRLGACADGPPALTVGPALKITEHGRNRRRALNRVYYPLQCRLPVRDAVLFISWKGKQCGDNPLAIAAELRRRGDDREQIWAVTDYSLPAPDGARTVLTGTEDYFEALGRCRYLIANDDMQAHYRKRNGQVYVQTWHGTPLKRIGFDVPKLHSAGSADYLGHLEKDVAKWDLLLSPNPFSTPVMRRAFRFGGEICESGYPRNDVLRSDDAGRITADVRRRLGVPESKRLVLYAPTWRDDQYYGPGRYRFDLRLDLQRAQAELGDDYVFLIRGHHHLANDVPDGPRPGFAVNVTSYPDISELLLVSDILVTDYSSIMFDFAPTGRPILLFTYDLEQYRDNLRGFYFDLEAEAPGPLLATSEEVVSAIAGIDAVAARHRAAAQAFTARFCPLDDGKASARACDRIFGG